jgi:Probable lipoprotein LpqN
MHRRYNDGSLATEDSATANRRTYDMAILRVNSMIWATVLLAALAVGCTREIAGVAMEHPVDEGTSSACTEVSAPLTSIPTEAPEEPRMLIPQPSGWHRAPNPGPEMVRFAMANASLTASRLALAAVGLKSKPGHDDPATVFDDLRWDAEKDPEATDLTFTDTTVCGYPAKTVNYTRLATDELPPRAETMLAVVVHTSSKTHAVVVTISTNDDDNPAYQRDLETILTGFQVLAPT